MATLETQYLNFLKSNPKETLSYEYWLENIWHPTAIKRIRKKEKRIWERVKQLRKEGLLEVPEDIEKEPSALAFTPYDMLEWDITLIDKLEDEIITNDKSFGFNYAKVLSQIYLLPYVKVTHNRSLNGNYEVILGWFNFEFSLYF